MTYIANWHMETHRRVEVSSSEIIVVAIFLARRETTINTYFMTATPLHPFDGGGGGAKTEPVIVIIDS